MANFFASSPCSARYPLDEGHGLAGGFLHARNLRQEGVALFNPQAAVDASGNAVPRVDLLASQGLDQLLAELAKHDALHRQVREFRDKADDVADSRVGIKPEKQVRARQMEEAQGVGRGQTAPCA